MKKTNSTILIILLIVLISIASLTISTSYSYILSNGSATNNTETIKTGNLSTVINVTNINYTNMTTYSENDAQLVSNTNQATIEIQKKSDYSLYYQLLLKDTTSNSSNVTTLLPLENVLVALYKVSGTSNTLVMGPIRVGDLPIVNDTGSDAANQTKNAEYQLYVGKFETSTGSNKFALKAWLAEDTDPEFNSKKVGLDLVVKQEPYHSKNVYTLTGSATGATEVVLNGQKATVQNGRYTLSNIVEGIYTLQVKNNNTTYETVLTILPGSNSTISLAANPKVDMSGNVVSANTSIQKLAYDNKTTVYQIMKVNSSLQNSNLPTPYQLWNLPTSYTLNVKPSLDVQTISNVNISISNGNITLSYSAASSDAAGEMPSFEDPANINQEPSFESIAPSTEILEEPAYEETTDEVTP